MHFAFVAALPPSARNNEAFETAQGSFFSGPEAEEAILAQEFAKELSPQPASLLGKEIVVRYAERQPLAGGDSAAAAGTEGADGPDDPFGFTVVRRDQKLRIVGIVEREPYGGVRVV